MAGDWIKVEHATVDKSEVLRIAEMLGIDRRQALGLLLDFWVWLDRNVSNENSVTLVTHMSRKSIDELTQCPGFAACLVDVGWAKMDDETGVLIIINGERHNGNPAKTRALARDRQITHKSRKNNANSVNREEKRRVLKQPSVVPTPTIDARASAGNNAFEKNNNPKNESKTEPKTAGRWDASEQATDAKGRELGVPAKPGEDYYQYRRRLWSAINERTRQQRDH